MFSSFWVGDILPTELCPWACPMLLIGQIWYGPIHHGHGDVEGISDLDNVSFSGVRGMK